MPTIYRTYKVRLHARPIHEKFFRRVCDARRVFFNRLNRLKKREYTQNSRKTISLVATLSNLIEAGVIDQEQSVERLKEHKKSLSWMSSVELQRLRTRYKGKAKYGWISVADSAALKDACIAVDQAWAAYLRNKEDWAKNGKNPNKKPKPPASRKRFVSDTYLAADDENRIQINAESSELWIPKMPQIERRAGSGRLFRSKNWIKFNQSQPIIGKPKSIRVISQAGHWYALIQCAIEVPEDQEHPNKDVRVGLDFGVRHLATLSNGKQFDAVDKCEKLDRMKKRLQRKIARCKPGSQNKKKLAQRIAKCERNIADYRSNVHHHVAKEIARDYGGIAVEDLQVKNMTKSAKGTAEEPGSHIAQKSGLNRSILHQAPGSLISKIQYKIEHAGGGLVKVPPQYTSTTCHACGHSEKENRKDEKFKCLKCGHEDNADVNAAKNILERGLKIWNNPELAKPKKQGYKRTKFKKKIAQEPPAQKAVPTTEIPEIVPNEFNHPQEILVA